MAAGTTVLGIVSFAVAQAPAHADPTEVYVAVGSDTIQDIMNGYATDLGGNEIGSYNAINPVTAVAHEDITPVEGAKGANCSFTRPNGSTEGENALRKSINPSTTAPQLADPPQQNCVDIGRSSAAPGADQKNDGQLVFIPFALDAVTTATGATTNITQADKFTKTDLTNLYANCTTVTEGGVTYNPGTATGSQVQINLYVPQSGSGTLKFWASTLGFSATSLPACDHQTILAGPSTGTAVEEHDGTAVSSDPNGMMPFSIAQWIAQSNSKSNGGSLPVTDRRHGATLHEINSIFPCSGPNSDCPAAGNGTMNTAFPITREVYNIVQYDRVVNTGDGHFDSALAGLLAGAGSALCQDIFTIQGYGFALLGTPATTDNCGSTANSLRAFDSTDPV